MGPVAAEVRRGRSDVSRGQKISFSATRYNGRPLGDFSAEPGGQPAVYVYLVPPSGGRPGGGKRTQGTEPAPGKSASSVPATVR